MFRLLIALLILVCPLTAADAPDLRLQTAGEAVARAMVAEEAAVMRTAYAAFNDTWLAVEEGVRKTDKKSYAAIEEAMGDLDYHLQEASFDLGEARAASARLMALLGAPAAAVIAPAHDGPTPAEIPTLATVHARTIEAGTLLAAGKADEAKAAIADVRRWWPDAEGEVKTRDGAAYRDIEELQARAAAQLTNSDPAAGASITALATRIEPFLSAGSYGVADSFLILLREGIEALLVIAALLAFLGRSGHADKKRIIWWGAGAGVGVSLALAVVIHLAFKAAFSGTDRELVEGVVGLVAAGLLFWVSWWLHRAANLSRWNNYIAGRTTAALASGSVVTLGTLAFLAVLREGAETALFYLGMAPSIATRDLLLGIGLASVALLVVGVVVIKAGARLPIRPFFAALGLLLLAMGVKFIGAGIHALQIAQIVDASVVAGVPTVELLGFFPTWETIAAQAIAIFLVSTLLWLGSRPAPARPEPL